MSGKLSKRTALTLLILVVAVPCLMVLLHSVWGSRKYFLASILLVALACVPFLLRFEGRKPQARELVLLSIMTALAVVGRIAFVWIPSFKPLAAIVILTGVAFSPEAGFITGAAAALLSNFYFGQGIWTPWQMLGFGLLGFLGGLIFSGRPVKRIPLVLYGFFSTLILYGLLLDTANVLMMGAAMTWPTVLASWASGVSFNLIHAGATALFLLLLQKPLLEKLRRVRIKYGLLDE